MMPLLQVWWHQLEVLARLAGRHTTVHLRALFASYAEIFFLPGGWLGVLFCAITMLRPNIGISGAIAVLAAYAFARLVGMEKTFLESGFYTRNPLLVGLSIGYVYQLSPLSVFFVVAAGVTTFLVTVSLAHVFMTYLRLPVLGVPFVIVSSIAYLASKRYSNLLVGMPAETFDFLHTELGLSATFTRMLQGDLGLPYWIAGFFHALSATLFTPNVLVGVVISVILLWHSRILFLLAATGFYTGALVRGAMLGDYLDSFGDFNDFNFIFIGMAVGGVFLVPSLTSYLMAIIGVCVSTLILDASNRFWAYAGITGYALPFNVTCLGMIFVLGLLRHRSVALSPGRTPEETLENVLANRLRYASGKDATLFLPVAGAWTVWQGQDGPWTHQGAWRHAIDFVITDSDGETCADEGTRLEDYYCYRKPVLSPIRGRVACVINDLPDSKVGSPDETNKWGNLVIIWDPRGFYVELSHFAHNSITVAVGAWVERGTVLGLCGNSGYSPQPHLHVQVQATETPGAASLPFSFVSYAQDGVYHANDMPLQGARVEPLYPDKRLEQVTGFLFDEKELFGVWRGGKRIGELLLTVHMAPDGTFYLGSPRGQLYFGKHEGTFYVYRVAGRDPWLRLLFLALPRLPLAYRDRLTWCDYVPVGLVVSGLREAVVGVLSSFYPPLATVKVVQTFTSLNRVEAVIEAGLLHVRQTATVEFDHRRGFATVTIGPTTFKRESTGTTQL